MTGIYINCKERDFVGMILAGNKAHETRTRNMLKNVVGERVALIETGTHKQPYIRGYATIASATKVVYNDIAARKAAGIYKTSYDIKEGGYKWFYLLEDVIMVRPYALPKEHINHGRSYTTF